MPVRRDRLTSDVGPAASGSKPGIECTQMPERSGTAAAPSVLLTAGAAACPKASGAAAATNVAIERKYHRCRFMVSSLFIWCRRQFADKATAFACRAPLRPNRFQTHPTDAPVHPPGVYPTEHLGDFRYFASAPGTSACPEIVVLSSPH